MTDHKFSISKASRRVSAYVHRTPLMSSTFLNQALGHDFLFKIEALQKVGAFKARGAMNTLLTLKEKGGLPKEVVAFSSGNHAQGVAWASREMGLKATILMPKYASILKRQATESYGAKIVLTEDRREAEFMVQEFIDKGAFFIHPYANPMVIEGQGTACYEALEDMKEKPDLIFAPCGGGGLLSGTYLASRELSPNSKIIGAEPITANDAARSLREGQIYSFEHSPETICDGVMTLHIADITFEFLKKLDAFLELDEESIIYWTQWLRHLLKLNIEPSSALAMAAAVKYLKDVKPNTKQKILIIVSGGNTAPDKQKLIWQKDYLSTVPSLV
jgi:threonine dehydratase